MNVIEKQISNDLAASPHSINSKENGVYPNKPEMVQVMSMSDIIEADDNQEMSVNSNANGHTASSSMVILNVLRAEDHIEDIKDEEENELDEIYVTETVNSKTDITHDMSSSDDNKSEDADKLTTESTSAYNAQNNSKSVINSKSDLNYTIEGNDQNEPI